MEEPQESTRVQEISNVIVPPENEVLVENVRKR